MIQSWTILVGSLAMLAGCAQLTPDRGHQREAAEQVSRVDRHSSFPAIRRLYFEQANLIEMIDPRGQAKDQYQRAWDDAVRLHGSDPERSWGIRYDLVLNWFRESRAGGDHAKQEHRNGVQDKMLAVSTSRCNVFKTFLRRQQSDVNFALGTATTAAGVLGAVLSNARDSRNLAGVAGFLSGTQAEYNSNYYSNLAAQVIIQGIELRQARWRKELLEGRRGKTIFEYSMEAAINDALVMDGTCSTVTGLIEASDSIKEISTPGLPRAIAAIAAVKAANEIAQAGKFSELADSGRLEKLLKYAAPGASPMAITSLGASANTDPTLLEKIEDASQAVERADAALEVVASTLLAEFTQTQQRLSEDKRAAKAVGDGLKGNFKPVVKAETNKLKLEDCAKALLEPAKAFGSALAAARLKPGDAAAQATAEGELLKARAEVETVMNKVSVLLAASRRTAEGTASLWQAKFEDAKLTLEILGAIKAPAVEGGLMCSKAN